MPLPPGFHDRVRRDLARIIAAHPLGPEYVSAWAQFPGYRDLPAQPDLALPAIRVYESAKLSRRSVKRREKGSR